VRHMLSAFVCLLMASPVCAASREDVLFDVIFDMDHSGILDRAVLVGVGPGRTDFSDPTKDTYPLAEGEHADLLIYLDYGDGPLDLAKAPTLRKQNLINRDSLSFVMPLAVNPKGSLRVISSNGFGNTINTTETLTVVHRDGHFLVAGWAQDFYDSREEQSSHCSVNYLAGKAVKRRNGGKDIALKGAFKPIALAEWGVGSTPVVCEGE
jgi:hypothetical protein